MKRRSYAWAIVTALFCAVAVPAQTASDDFNRSAGTNMGPDWAEIDGDTVIENNQAKGNTPFFTGWMHHTGLSGNYADSNQSVEFFANGFGGDSVSLMAGLDPNTWDCVFVKVQDNNGDGLFDRLFFYRGVNGGSWGGSSVFFDLATPTDSGTMTLSFQNSGDVAVVDIDNGTSGQTESYQGTGILTMPFGPPTGVNLGIGHFGDPFFDNWSASIGPIGPTYSLANLVAGQTVTATVSNVTPLATVVIGYSLAGPGPTSTPYGLVDMSLPILQLPPIPADASGVATASLTVPGAAAGRTVYTQAVELPAGVLSNSLAEPIL